MRFALLLLLTSCSGVQGIPVAPRPPAFSPVTDAPITIGQPGTQPRGVAIEPNPKPSRALPESPETRRGPGIWASKEPETDPTISVLGVPLWAPDADTDVMGVYHRCAAMANTATSVKSIPAAERLRMCLAPLLIYHCVMVLEDKRPEWAQAKAMEKARKHMSNMASGPCGGFTKDQLERYLEPFIREFARDNP